MIKERKKASIFIFLTFVLLISEIMNLKCLDGVWSRFNKS